MKRMPRKLAYLFIALAILAVPAGLVISKTLNIPVADEGIETRLERVFNAEHYTLDNGLEVVVIPNHRAPVVTHMVWYKVGAADEDMGKSGIAHFMEHLMFKGSEGLAAGEFSEVIRGLGGNDNAFTSQDYTAYFQSIAVEHLRTVMIMEAGRMRGMNPAAGEVASERQVVLEERAQRTDNNPSARFGESMDAALYVNHPYGIPVIGWRHEVAALERLDAMNFYNRWYAPNNAILVVAGDVESAEVLALATEIYGVLPTADTPKRVRTISPPLDGSITVKMHDARVREPSIQMAIRVPSARQDYDVSLALEVLANIMGGGSSSRIYTSLVVEQKLASSAGLFYRSDAWDDGEIMIYATPLPDVSMEDLRTALELELTRVVEDGVSAEELSSTISRLQDAAVYARDSLSGPAMIVGRSLATGQSLDQVELWTHYIGAVTAEAVHEAARAYISPDSINLVGYLLPEEEVKQEVAQ